MLRATIRTDLDEHCIDCHQKKPLDLTADDLSKPIMSSVLEYVAFGVMPPRPEHISPVDRTSLVKALLALLWSDPTQRKVAEEYYLGQMRTVPVFDRRAILKHVEDVAGKSSGMKWLEPSVSPDLDQLTPGLVGVIAAESIRACRAHARSDADFSKCIEEAVSIDPIVRPFAELSGR